MRVGGEEGRWKQHAVITESRALVHVLEGGGYWMDRAGALFKAGPAAGAAACSPSSRISEHNITVGAETGGGQHRAASPLLTCTGSIQVLLLHIHFENYVVLIVVLL